MADFLAWSHSRRNTYLQCPRQLWHMIAPKGHSDRVEFEQTKPMRDGQEVDNALTARISKGTPLEPKYAPYEPICQMVIAAPGQKFTQMQLALDRSFKPCGYKDWDTAWIRVIYDLAIIDGNHAVLVDWKNGKISVNDDQLRLFAAVGFHQFPEIETIDVSYVWLTKGTTTDDSYRRRDLPDMWQALLPDVERMQASFKANHWPAAPKNGKNTCAYCGANKAGKCKDALGAYKG